MSTTQMSMLTVPGCLNYWQNGFNASSASFDCAPMFELSFASNNYVIINGLPYTYPDNVSFDQSSQNISFVFAESIQYYSQFSGTFGGAVSGSSSGIDLCLSGDTQFSFEGSILQSFSSLYEVAFEICDVGGFNVPSGPAPLTASFSTDLAAALAQPSTQSWSAFFGTYGTHYLQSARLGGFSVLQLSIADTLLQTDSSEALQVQFQTDFSNMVGGDDLGIDGYTQTSSWYQANSASIEVYAVSKGGSPSQQVSDFQASCLQYPIPLLFKNPDVGVATPIFVPISALASNSQDQATIDSAIAQYLTVGENGTYANPTSFQPSASQALATDAIVFASVASTQANTNPTAQISSDQNNFPSTIVAQSAVDTDGCPKTIQACVNKGFNVICASDSAVISLISLPGIANTQISLPGAANGSWDSSNCIYSGQAQSDGFLSVYLSGQDAQNIELTATISGTDVVAMAGSQSELTPISFTMPLLNNQAYQISSQTPVANFITFTTYSLVNSFSFGTATAVNINTNYQASTDLICTIVCPVQSGSTTLQIQISAQQDSSGEMGGNTVLTLSSISSPASLCFPVPANSWFAVACDTQTENITMFSISVNGAS